ncbi:MAG: hypothetical protein HZT40_04435 [Candidatus Thiothrix singaporensis]|uniref:Uncharacterized protein n=1 Tax=Candidatus Thiothrix singaporensis TaxID=2799669 RepID=A0A7L6API2_9GAMM|nr:MAG: hypothetical protein HZT40_04435 [Candidatus Thiothrix singaporensis]
MFKVAINNTFDNGVCAPDRETALIDAASVGIAITTNITTDMPVTILRNIFATIFYILLNSIL